jgi:predicted nucleotidyltransferase
MATGSWLSSLAILLQGIPTSTACEVWLFGSALRSNQPSDLDVLVVYEDGRMSDALQLRERLTSVASRVGLPSLHFVTLSASEEAAVNFAYWEGAVKIPVRD